MKRPAGTISRAWPEVQGQRLRVRASVKTDGGELLEAQIPDREVAAILPRSVLVGGGARAPLSILDTMRPIIQRMCEGRRARVWLYKERWFLSFQPWKSVRFVDDAAVEPAAEAAIAPSS